jgi:hypothetical protein
VALTANNVATFPYEMPATAQTVTETLTIDCTTSGKPDNSFGDFLNI